MSRADRADCRIDEPQNQRKYDMMGARKRGAYIVFCFFAPNARAVYLTGSFNGWSESVPLSRASDGVWETYVEVDRVPIGSTYKYKVYIGDGVEYHSDPYAEMFDDSVYKNSVFLDRDGFEWNDYSWRSDRYVMYRGGCSRQPVSIYSLYLFSWRPDRERGNSLEKTASDLIPYLKQMGYTHIKVSLPFMHRQSGDGREQTALFALDPSFTDRHGFKVFVDSMHRANIGVIAEMDTSDCSNGAVAWELLLSSVCFWIERYHIDGVELACKKREDAENIHSLISLVRKRFEDIIVISSGQAEAFDGLGASLIYSESPLRDASKFSGGCALVDLFDGVEISDNKLALAKVSAACRVFLGGKKLTRAGDEIGSFGTETPDWSLVERWENAGLQLFCADLGYLYLRYTQLWSGCAERVTRVEDIPEVYIKKNEYAGELVIIINPSSDEINEVELVGISGSYRVIFNSDIRRYGGNSEDIKRSKRRIVASDNGITIKIPACSVIVLERIGK